MIMLHKKMNKNCVFMFFLGIPPPLLFGRFRASIKCSRVTYFKYVLVWITEKVVDAMTFLLLCNFSYDFLKNI